MEALMLPCPFCGSQGQVYIEQVEPEQPEDNYDLTYAGSAATFYQVKCTYCEAAVPKAKKLKVAINRWNRRAES